MFLFVITINVIKSIKCVKLYSTFYISHTIRTNGLLYLTGHNECPLLTILLTQESPTTFRMISIHFNLRVKTEESLVPHIHKGEGNAAGRECLLSA